MTDFDFEILEAIAAYGAEGIDRAELQRRHFAQYDIMYNLYELARGEKFSNGKITLSFENSAYLKCREKKNPPYVYEIYSLTDKGRALLTNWQRRRSEQLAAQNRRECWERLINVVVGVGTGFVATLICTKILGL